MGRGCGGSTSPSPTTRCTRPWPRWTWLPESGRWTRLPRAASSTWDSASSVWSGSSAPDERGEHRDQPVGELAHHPGVLCGSVAKQGGHLHGSCCFARLPSGNGKCPRLVRQAHPPGSLGTIEASALRRPQRLVPQLRVPHL